MIWQRPARTNAAMEGTLLQQLTPSDTTGVIDLFYVLIAALLVTIIAFIVRAVRLTNASIERAGREIPLSRPDIARRVIDEMRRMDVWGTRCGGPAFAMLDTGNRYMCETDACRFEFEGPEHFPQNIA